MCAAAAAVTIRTFRSSAPDPPALDSLGPLAPEIEDLVRQAREGVAQDPRDGTRWGRFGMVCEANGLTGAARDAYAAAAAAQPSEARWEFHLAVVDARLGRTDEAIREMGRAIDLNPTYAPAFWRLGSWLLDQNQLEGAERAFDRSTEIDPADRAGWIGLARVYLQRDELERAAGLLERLASGAPSDGLHTAAAWHGLPAARTERPSGVGPAGRREGGTAVERRLDRRDAGVPPGPRRAVEGCSRVHRRPASSPRRSRSWSSFAATGPMTSC